MAWPFVSRALYEQVVAERDSLKDERDKLLKRLLDKPALPELISPKANAPKAEAPRVRLSPMEISAMATASRRKENEAAKVTGT